MVSEDGKKVFRIFFGYPANVCGTSLEEELKKRIREYVSKKSEIVCLSNNKIASRLMRHTVLQPETLASLSCVLADSCDFGFFLPFSDGTWAADVYEGAKAMDNSGKHVHEISPEAIIRRIRYGECEKIPHLSYKETTKKIWDDMGNILPYK